MRSSGLRASLGDDLPLLQQLNLTGNMLSRLPNSFSRLEQLRTLQLAANRFTRVPPEVGSLLA